MVGTIYRKNFQPEAIALKYKGNAVTYAQLDQTVLDYAAALKTLGLQKDDRVILSCPNSPEFIYAYFSVVRGGGIIVPINLLLTLEEIQYLVEDSEAKFMLVHPLILEKAKVTADILSAALNVQVIALDDQFKALAAASAGSSVPEIDDESEISTFLYTSGTTGKQKAAMLSHHNLVFNAEQSKQALTASPADNFMCVLPMFHVFAFTVCVLMPLLAGSTITIVESFLPKEVIESLMKDGITVFAGVPTMYVVLNNLLKGPTRFPDLRYVVSGGAALPVEVLQQARKILQVPVIEGYGLTEASPVVCVNPLDGIQKEGSIGIALPFIDIKIVDEQGNECPRGEVGELAVRGENVMTGYFKRPEDNKKALVFGWLHTGDLAKIDEDGYVFIVDRKKDLVIVGGLNVYPREVEEVIYQYPKVKEAAVIGLDDHLRGEYVKAFVVLKDNETCTSRELLNYMKIRLASYKLPREIEFIAALPKNSTGKILKRVLKDQAVGK